MPHAAPLSSASPSAIATAEQIAASDPRTSAFVSANAGSGKTTLLIDRLLRLLLEGAEPQGILCLTYTRAAAAEMAVRLQERLGRWVRLDDAGLNEALSKLTFTPDAGLRDRARALFARVLDLPGGMRIATIHAFCQSVLRKFPLEAGISPYFALIDDAEAASMRREAQELALPALAPAVLAQLAARINLDGFSELARELEAKRRDIAALLRASPGARAQLISGLLDLEHDSDAEILAELAQPPDEAELRRAALVMAQAGGVKVQENAAKMLDWLALTTEQRIACHADWIAAFFTKRSPPAPRADGGFANKAILQHHPFVLPVALAEQARLEHLQAALAGSAARAASLALLAASAPMIEGVIEAKTHRARLDYDDLIATTQALLAQPDDAAWVLFKLDAGLDHLLLDEVQDTAPAQWRIAASLTGDFFSGQGSERRNEMARTLFAVGDRKQSIFSFQGARPAEFADWQSRFGAMARRAGHAFRDSKLAVSFRSTAPVLALVDAVFDDPRAAHGVTEGSGLRHLVHRSQADGQVMLWPLAPPVPKSEAQPWTPPAPGGGRKGGAPLLAEALADYLQAELAGGVMLVSRGRPLRPGDVLVLVRTRSAFDSALTQALKKRNIPVAGLDRMKLTEQIAVADLLSLARAILLPEDDLSFAEWLKSPLGGLDEQQLMDLAAGRAGTLLAALRAQAGRGDPRAAAAFAFYDRLGDLADYLSPFDLLAEALGPLGGRARLLARLGPDAADAIDELLAQATAFARANTPSLQGFLFWLERGGTDVKREAEAAGNAVRIMTVHGAKGLEAPFVILPDTTRLPKRDDGLVWTEAQFGNGGMVPVPIVATKGSGGCPAIADLRRAAAEEKRAEYNRLLYVALTRAQDRLLVCGWANGQTSPPAAPADSWYALIAAAMARIGAVAIDGLPGRTYPWGQTLVLTQPNTGLVKTETQAAQRPAPPMPRFAGFAPDWRAAPPPASQLARPLAPSRPDGVEYGPPPPARSPLARAAAPDRFLRGQVIHALLQHLPALPPAARGSAAARYASAALGDAARGARAAAEALAVLDLPELAPLFGPGSRAEQPIQGVIGAHAIAGLIDRLAVTEAAVFLADFKTNRDPPGDVAGTPVAYVRQMAAYRSLLTRLYPDRPVRALLIWTDGPRVDLLPDTLLDAHDPQRWAA